MAKILVLVASAGKNVELGNKLAVEIEAQGAEAEVVKLVDYNFPLYSTEEEKNGIPEKAKELADKLVACRGFIAVAPEYNGSVPPVLNNTIAWISRTGDDWRGAFNGKVAAIATHSGGGGLHGLMAMRAQFSYIGVNVLGRQLHTHHGKELNPESVAAVIKNLLELTR